MTPDCRGTVAGALAVYCSRLSLCLTGLFECPGAHTRQVAKPDHFDPMPLCFAAWVNFTPRGNKKQSPAGKNFQKDEKKPPRWAVLLVGSGGYGLASLFFWALATGFFDWLHQKDLAFIKKIWQFPGGVLFALPRWGIQYRP